MAKEDILLLYSSEPLLRSFKAKRRECGLLTENFILRIDPTEICRDEREKSIPADRSLPEFSKETQITKNGPQTRQRRHL
jgi:hypothetical protein